MVKLLASQWFKLEFLPRNGSLEHQTGLTLDEGDHAFMIFGFCLDAGLGARTGASTFPGGPDLSLSTRSYCNRLGSCVEFKIAAGELVIGPLVLKEDDLAESFAANLEPD